MTGNTSPRIKQPVHPDLITRAEAAAMLGRSVSWVSTRSGLHEYVIGPKCILVDRKEVEAYVAKPRRNAAASK